MSADYVLQNGPTAPPILPLTLGIAALLMALISFAVFLLSVGRSDFLSISVYLQFLLQLLTKLLTFTLFFDLLVLLPSLPNKSSVYLLKNAVPSTVNEPTNHGTPLLLLLVILSWLAFKLTATLLPEPLLS